LAITPQDGLVIRYSYLWAREHDRGEETGRKARPACLQIIMKRKQGGTIVMLFPITSQIPQSDRTALAIPDIEARRARLTTPAWIILDEFNLDTIETSLHINGIEPLGVFSSAFMKKVRSLAAERIRKGQYRRVPRA
jgi:hypothetical protein